MSLQVKYSCGTCGLVIIDAAIYTHHSNCIKRTEIWHECCDGYIVPLQSVVEKAPKEPVKEPHAVHQEADYK